RIPPSPPPQVAESKRVTASEFLIVTNPLVSRPFWASGSSEIPNDFGTQVPNPPTCPPGSRLIDRSFTLRSFERILRGFLSAFKKTGCSHPSYSRLIQTDVTEQSSPEK